MITKTLEFKNNIEFFKLMNDDGMEVSDDLRKQTMDVAFQSFIAQNGINEPNKEDTSKMHATSKRKRNVDNEVSTKKSSVNDEVLIKEIVVENPNSDSGECFASGLESCVEDFTCDDVVHDGKVSEDAINCDKDDSDDGDTDTNNSEDDESSVSLGF